MEIGSKLKSARAKAGLTQEAAAEKIGVSRQTMSNWENNKTYPDVISVIGLSELYSISLDELLKGDKGMIRYLEESTNNVKSRQQYARLIQVMVYLGVWAASMLTFWLEGSSGGAAGYALLVFYLILPVTTFVISIFIGKDDGWANTRWLMLLFFGVMYMLAEYGTFSLANMIAFDKVNLPSLTDMLPGILCSAAGMLFGTAISAVKRRKQDKAGGETVLPD